MSNIFDTERYEVVIVDEVLCEDGRYHERPGYGVINKDTGVVEHTTTMLPGAIFQCTHFNETLNSLLKEPERAELVSIDVSDDVVPH